MRLKKIVVSQLAIIVLWTISLIVYFGSIPGFGEDATLVGLLPIIIIQINLSMLVLGYLFTSKVRSCFGKSNFSTRCRVDTDVEGV
jgi:hypothetical protein